MERGRCTVVDVPGSRFLSVPKHCRDPDDWIPAHVQRRGVLLLGYNGSEGPPTSFSCAMKTVDDISNSFLSELQK